MYLNSYVRSEGAHCSVKFEVLTVVFVKIEAFEVFCIVDILEELAASIFVVQEFQEVIWRHLCSV
jgi:hypothetical protein